MGRAPALRLPDGGRLSYFRTYGQFWVCRSQLPDASVRALLERTLPARGVALDVGAYVGVFAVMLGKLRPDATVYAFEPTPASFSKLSRNVADNRLAGVQALNLGVADVPGMMPFQHAHSPMEIRFAPEADASAPDTVVVASTTLDAFCGERGIETIDFLKIDVEGAEPRVLARAWGLPRARRVRCGFVEACPANLAALGSSPAALAAEAEASGYGFFALNDQGAAGPRLSADDLAQREIDNVLMLPL